MRSLTTFLATLAPAAHAQPAPGKILIKLEKAAKLDAGKELGLAFDKRSVYGWLVATLSARQKQSTSALEKWTTPRSTIRDRCGGASSRLRTPPFAL